MIHIRYFGQLSDQLGITEEGMPWNGGTTEQLLQVLRARGEPWVSALEADKVFKIAINHVLTHKTAEIPDGAEVGILPPVTGG